MRRGGRVLIDADQTARIDTRNAMGFLALDGTKAAWRPVFTARRY